MLSEYLSLLLLFVVGACAGSFIGVLSDRVFDAGSIVSSRSRCNSCRKTLKTIDLIPIFSFIFLGGKCRYCHKKIPRITLVIEIVCGLVLVLVGLFYPWEPLISFCLVIALTIILLALFFVDLKQGILPDVLLIVGCVIVTFLNIQLGWEVLLFHFAMGALLFILFGAVYYFSHGRGIGFGDVKFAFLIGYLLGFPGSLIAVYLAFVIGAVVALVLIGLGRKKLRGDTISFGPFLTSGVIIVLLFYQEIYTYIYRVLS